MKPIDERLRKRSLVTLSALGGAIIFARVWAVAGPERLCELPGRAAVLAVRGDEAYVQRDFAATGVEAWPLAGGPSRPVSRRFPAGGAVVSARLTPSSVVYTAERRRPDPNSTAGLFNTSAVLYEDRLDGGLPKRILPQLATALPVVSSRTCYWLRPHQPRTAAPADTLPPRRDPRFDVIASPLDRWEPRVLESGITGPTTLYPLDAGVLWAVTGSGAARELFCALEPAYQPRRLGSHTEFGPPVVVDGRCYWTDIEAPASGPEPDAGARARILSAGLDDGKPRLEADLLAGRRWEPRARLIGVRQGRVYALLAERRAGRSEAGLSTLCRVDPHVGVQRLHKLPPTAGIIGLDAPYLYFTVSELRENWLDWSPRGLRARPTLVLYRYRLPA